MAKLYKSNGDIVDVEPKNGRTFMLEELRELLTCDLVGPVFLKDGKIMLVDEEGKLTKSDINPKATQLMHSSRRINWDFIVGDALVCNTEQFI